MHPINPEVPNGNRFMNNFPYAIQGYYGNNFPCTVNLPFTQSAVQATATTQQSVQNNGNCLDVQFPDPGQIDFDYLQKMHQESQWDRFYQESLNKQHQQGKSFFRFIKNSPIGST